MARDPVQLFLDVLRSRLLVGEHVNIGRGKLADARIFQLRRQSRSHRRCVVQARNALVGDRPMPITSATFAARDLGSPRACPAFLSRLLRNDPAPGRRASASGFSPCCNASEPLKRALSMAYWPARRAQPLLHEAPVVPCIASSPQTEAACSATAAHLQMPCYRFAELHAQAPEPQGPCPRRSALLVPCGRANARHTGQQRQHISRLGHKILIAPPRDGRATVPSFAAIICALTRHRSGLLGPLRSGRSSPPWDARMDLRHGGIVHAGLHH